ncbi:MAG: glycosyltransferase family 4 protein [Bacteroidia bacterium]|nr:glycosyltransferase family 4 protein [Bacteroidia bacterium]
MSLDEKILVLSYYFPPSGGSGVQRWTYFCKYLPEFGIRPVVVTVDPARASYRFTDESLLTHVASTEVVRTSTLEPFSMYSGIAGGDRQQNIPQGFAGESDPGPFKKISRFIRGNFFLPDARKGWIRYAIPAALKLIKEQRIKAIISTGPPHSTHLAALKIRKATGVKWIADFRDPWTEVYYNNMLYRTAWAVRKDSRMEQEVINSADHILTVGPGMMSLLKKKFYHPDEGKISFIYNGYDQEAFSRMIRKPDPAHFVICYTGILSDNQPVSPFLDALKSVMKDNPDFGNKLQIKLTGSVSPRIEEEIAKTVGGERFIHTAYKPHEEALGEMLNADLLLNSLPETRESDLIVSGKLMEYLATGNPVLVLGSETGDAAALMKNTGHQKVFARADVRGIRDFIQLIFNTWKEGKQFSPRDMSPFSRLEASRHLASLIRRVTG